MFISSASIPSPRAETARALDVRGEVGAEEVDPHRDAEVAQERQLVAQERLDADVLEADRVEHPGRGLADPRQRVAGARQRRDALGRQTRRARAGR
jgi:hypothetical protein